jgi:hypothetical protein
VATREKFEKEKKKYPLTKRRAFHQTTLSSSSSSQVASATSLGQHSDKYGIMTPIYKHLSGGSTASTQMTDAQPMSYEQQFRSLVKPAVPVETFDDLPSDLYTQNIKLNSCMYFFINILNFN